jgi:hypothetical protein
MVPQVRCADVYLDGRVHFLVRSRSFLRKPKNIE